MQMAQKLEAIESGEDDDMPMTKQDYRALRVQLDEITKKLDQK